MILYHGSDHILEKPLYGKGKGDNDYGQGFYTTEDPDKAKSWAVTMGGDDAFCNQYDLDITGLNILNLDDYGTLAWISEIVSHRGSRTELGEITALCLMNQYKIDTSQADIIIGYRADDSYLDIIDAFLSDQLSVEETKKLFYEGDFGEQVFVKSQKAFNQITFQKAESVKDHGYSETENNARKNVSRFLLQRQQDVVLKKYQVQGLTVSDVISSPFIYDQSTGFYILGKGAGVDVPFDE